MRYLHTEVLTSDRGIIKPDKGCIQLVVNNPTTGVIKLGEGLITTNSYRWIVKANSLFVSPLMNFTSIYYVIDSFTAGALIQASVYAYDRWVGAPQISVLT